MGDDLLWSLAHAHELRAMNHRLELLLLQLREGQVLDARETFYTIDLHWQVARSTFDQRLERAYEALKEDNA